MDVVTVTIGATADVDASALVTTGTALAATSFAAAAITLDAAAATAILTAAGVALITVVMTGVAVVVADTVDTGGIDEAAAAVILTSAVGTFGKHIIYSTE